MNVPIDQLLLKEPVVAGMDFMLLGELARMYRNSNEHTTPIQVRPIGELDGATAYRVMDGRHRVIASVIAGRKTVLSEVVE